MKLSKEQKRIAKRVAIEAVILSIVMVIIYPLIKGESLFMPDTLISFVVFAIGYILVSSLLFTLFRK